MLFHFLTGKFITILGFVAAVLSMYAYFRSAQNEQKPALRDEWRTHGRDFFWVMFGSISVSGLHLLYLILSHQFEYSYVKHYSSTDLNLFYLISTFYAGQEGSFLLWLFFAALCGIFVIRAAKDYEPHVMSVLTLSQAFLLSMLLGIELPVIGTVGSDPFTLVPGIVKDASLFSLTLSAIPEGDGLNPLLQNPWMVIHPPTLFVGFASLIVPFGFAIAAMWRQRYDDWIRPAMPWTLFGTGSLGLGIIMGGYWAYKVLGWGGYWGWDPVENSSLVPWLVMSALIHTMIVQKKNGGLKRTNLLLAVLAYVFVLYSTFLTRSGILGDFSVHSFTDLGLYNQLLVFVIGFLALGIGFLLFRMRTIPVRTSSEEIFSREYFLLAGSVVLLLISFVVAAGTSAPILNRLFTDRPNPILPEFYNRVTLPLAILIGLFSAVGQLLWWKKIDKETLMKAFAVPLGLSVFGTGALVILGLHDPAIALFAFASFLSLFANGQMLVKILSGNPRYIGGSLTHVGLALMLLGILAGYYDRSEHAELPKGEPVEIFGKTLTYTGAQTPDGEKNEYVIKIEDGDETLEAKPVMYETNNMVVQNPDVLHSLTNDFYISPVNIMLKGNPNVATLGQNETKRIGDYEVKFVGFKLPEKIKLDPNAAKPLRIFALLAVTHTGKTDTLKPAFTLAPGKESLIEPDALPGNPNIKFAMTDIDPRDKKVLIEAVGLNLEREGSDETLIIEASLKPFINVLWLGTYLVTFGFIISIYRRWRERRFEDEIEED
ncbi:cytochrome c assembly protein [Chloroherpeton thalassium ATCC 35110]|uniref:Cytochrome c assembly protein n=1 Tax=Chloroherpeton thalassium (strain ATCC 35110 / GB-78) TaxID=517418 RepID=B3QVN0_CHLT3|nr:cytochrome c biogenesis protein CcsA [Chloroherpeton thalassium]ACF13087.1 cytochrome c assembly protein [Chloroherpeton thalassium ATCC 35110]